MTPFELVVSDFSAIIAAVNAKYGVRFASESDAGVSQDTVLKDIDARSRAQFGGALQESKVSRPSTTRKPSDEFLQNITDKERQAMEGALDAYRQFVGKAPDSPGNRRRLICGVLSIPPTRSSKGCHTRSRITSWLRR